MSLEPFLSKSMGDRRNRFPQGRSQIVRLGKVLYPTNVCQLLQNRNQVSVVQWRLRPIYRATNHELANQVDASIRCLYKQ